MKDERRLVEDWSRRVLGIEKMKGSKTVEEKEKNKY